uniref:GLTSCR protein conserved domain-containing protein n=1 Tax=Plectus sambesii TaxID=2011161 RepID=A0A914UV32_9BILA
MPRPLNGSSRKRPQIAPVSAKNVQPAQQTVKTPSSAQSGMIVRLSSENAEIVNRISGEIARLQTDQNNSGLDHSDVIHQLEQHRARIFGEALRTQHSVQAPQIAPSPPPPPPPPVCRQPNQRIVSINGQNYLMFDGHPLALHSASANESVAISSSPSMPSGPSVQSMESLPPTPNGPTGPVISERNAKRSARPPRSSATFSKSTTHAANAKPSDAQIARRQSQLKAERTNRLREQFAAQTDRLEAVDTVTPFSSLGDAVERLLPFHVYDEPEFNADALRTFDDNYLRYSARLMYQKRMLEHRFRAALYREAMTPFAEKAEESLLAYLHSRHEQELLDRDRELAKADLEGFVAQSEICAAGRAEGMNADLQND